jgi:dihydrofolate reductase
MIRLIVAFDRQHGIAKHGFQPWNLPADEAYFTEKTKLYGGNVLVGSTTYRTFSGALVERAVHVLTSDETPIEGVEVVHDLKKFLKDYADKDLWVAGGANVYSQLFEADQVDEIYVTRIEADFGCNQFFPAFEEAFVLAEQSDLKEQNGFIFRYEVYTKSIK